jgi:hypothetical protein
MLLVVPGVTGLIVLAVFGGGQLLHRVCVAKPSSSESASFSSLAESLNLNRFLGMRKNNR